MNSACAVADIKEHQVALINICGVTQPRKNSNSVFSTETYNSFVYRCVSDAWLNSISLPFRGNYLPLNNLPIWGW